MTCPHDITAGAETPAWDAESALDALMRYTRECVQLIDLDGTVVRWNGPCEESFGWSARAVTGRHLPHVPAELQRRYLKELRAVAASGRVAERDIEIERGDGSRALMRQTIIPVCDADGSVAGVFVISDEAGKDARFEGQRDRLLRGLSSALREPVAACVGLANLLLRSEIVQDPPRRDRTAKALVRRATDALSVLDSVDLVESLRGGSYRASSDPVDLGSLVGRVIAQRSDADRVMFDYDPTVPLVAVDAEAVRRAIEAVVDNALRFSEGGAGVGVSVYAVQQYAVVEVRNGGVGIATAERESLSGPYVSADRAGVPGGLGTGLYLARAIAEAHGGYVTITNDREQGTSVAVCLPVDPARRGDESG